MNAGKAMIKDNKVEDPQKLEERLEDLRVRWEAISALAATKQDRYTRCPYMESWKRGWTRFDAKVQRLWDAVLSVVHVELDSSAWRLSHFFYFSRPLETEMNRAFLKRGQEIAQKLTVVFTGGDVRARATAKPRQDKRVFVCLFLYNVTRRAELLSL